jgi:Tfp pilus assembly protein PilF
VTSKAGACWIPGHFATSSTVPLSCAALFLTLFPWASSCTSSPPSIPTHDEVRAHELTLQALDLFDTDAAQAEQLMHAALQADAYHGPAHNDLGVLYLRQSRLFDAANEFELARKLMPGNPDPRLNLGLTLERAGQYERAFDAYNAALEVSPAHIRTIQAIARLTLRTARKDDRLKGLLEDVALRGETEEWRSWATDQLSRSRR